MTKKPAADIDRDLGQLVHRALSIPSEKFPLPFTCRKGCTNIDQCADKRLNKGCYCWDFESWRNGPPQSSAKKCRKRAHANLAGLVRDHEYGWNTQEDRPMVAEGKCWYCILQNEASRHKIEAARLP